ncbi:hypothetical protein M1E11_22510 [Bacillus sp. JZ8]
MKIFPNTLLVSVSASLLYIFIVFVAPMFLMMAGSPAFSSSPELFGHALYVLNIADQEFLSKATNLGLILSFILGGVLYYGGRTLRNKRFHKSL